MTNAQTLEIITNSPNETIETGRKLGAALVGGMVVAITGPLGAGKTHLIKGIVAGLDGQDLTKVNSPTFVMVNEYAGRAGAIVIYHIDAYRIENARQFEMLGFEDFCRPDAVVLIEWADRVTQSLAGLEVIATEMSHIADSRRKIRIENPPAGLSIINNK